MSADVIEVIKQQIRDNPVILYMKGSPGQPQCGFSALLARLDAATREESDDQEPPRLSPEEQIRLAEEMRARIKSETADTPAAAEDPMVARMRKLAQKAKEQAVAEKPSTPPALTISIPEDPAEPELPAAPEETFEQIKSKIVADTLQQAQSAQLDVQKAAPAASAAKPSAPMTATEEPALEAGMLDRLRRLAGLSAPTKQAPEPAPEPEAEKPPHAEPVAVVEPPAGRHARMELLSRQLADPVTAPVAEKVPELVIATLVG